jgi:hypothetical protein
MRLEIDGAEHFPRALAAESLQELTSALAGSGDPGRRITDMQPLRRWLGPDGPVGRLAVSVLGEGCRPVRAILFDKTPDANWSLGWHQDRTIAVTARCNIGGFDRWTVKNGTVHVEPPFEILERMLTLRVHLDPVGPENAPLLISPGSHALGRISEEALASVVTSRGEEPCLADAGDIWMYRTPIVHASDRARVPVRRRVLQVDYSAMDLPPPLKWAMVV